jgi:anti-sigma regulatory factor (Ser/Thr protein kinase)
METLIIPGTLDELSELMDYVNQAAMAAGLDERATYRLCLAVDEIATNIICYGYDAAGKSGDLTAWAEIEAEELEIHLQDTAQTFDPRQAPPPEDLNRPLEEREAGGLGIYLALWGVDDFNYEHTPLCNHSIFIMKRNESEGKLLS